MPPSNPPAPLPIAGAPRPYDDSKPSDQMMYHVNTVTTDASSDEAYAEQAALSDYDEDVDVDGDVDSNVVDDVVDDASFPVKDIELVNRLLKR